METDPWHQEILTAGEPSSRAATTPGVKQRKRADVVRAARRTVKEKLKKDVATGKHGAYYPKRSELRKMEAEAKFEEIKKRGGDEAVDKAIAKRRKKNVAKEAKSMPSHMIR